MDKEIFELLNKEVDKLETIKLLRDIYEQMIFLNNRLSALERQKYNDYTFYGDRNSYYPITYRHGIYSGSTDTSASNGGTKLD